MSIGRTFDACGQNKMYFIATVPVADNDGLSAFFANQVCDLGRHFFGTAHSLQEGWNEKRDLHGTNYFFPVWRSKYWSKTGRASCVIRTLSSPFALSRCSLSLLKRAFSVSIALTFRAPDKSKCIVDAGKKYSGWNESIF